MSNTAVNPKSIAQTDEQTSSTTEPEAQAKTPGGRQKTILWERKGGLFGRNPVPRD